ncbi:hypothetical protein [Antarcticimicrobium sediminis]|uniref:Uncharacterized protein n=1 Tax=Antarcticimicrobium sediminis TaxID=2546227 RepID=A0A4R5EJZ3_9RHOB|nr:hypothetical protein [Antarcticimicrobium sediminis]TDE34680.1 hypothetical protein E1B25_19325 [Antarcticimicrobium sediminis]
MKIVKWIGVNVAHIALATVTSMSVCGALFVIPALNGGDPSLIWSLIGIASAITWGALNLVSDDFPAPLQIVYAISAFIHFFAIGTLAVLQGLLFVITILFLIFGDPPALNSEFALMVSNCVMLVVLACATAVIFFDV